MGDKLMILSDEEKMARYAHEEKQVREENLRLQRKLQLEIERREALCRTLSESESSLEMDDERFVKQLDSLHTTNRNPASKRIVHIKL